MKTQAQIDDDGSILKDGQRYRIPVMLLDAQQRAVGASPIVKDSKATAMHKPGSLPLSDADRQKRVTLYQGADKALSNRWRAPPSVSAQANEPVKDTTPLPATDIAAAYSRADARLSARWKGGAA